MCDITIISRYGEKAAKRHLLSEDVVKLQDFQRRKLAVAHLITGSDGNFIEMISHKLQRNSLVLQDELKLLLHLCQSEEDVKTARDAIYRYHAENRNMAHGEFRFGPLFMRLCYELRQEQMAAATLTDHEMKGFFSESTSFNIGIDMLFMKGYHEEALEVLGTMRSQRVPFNKDTLVLASAVCYKLNTTESYTICTSLIDEAVVKGHFIPRHAYCFAVALALKQNDVKKAQLFFSQIMTTDSRLCQNIKVLVLAMSGSIKEAIAFLFSAGKLAKNLPFVRKPEFSHEVLDQVVLHSASVAQEAEAKNIVSQLERAGQVTQQSLDDMLCHTPAPKRKVAPIMEERHISRRTLKPLHSTLLSE
nr:pentatricopeptide repeat-containing protein 2, mitochondrial [Nerophis lumbriciformis]